MMEPDVVTGPSFRETVVGSKGGEELKDELRNSEQNDVRCGESVEGGEKSVVEGDNMDGGEVGRGDAERREENVEAKDGTAREDVGMVETGYVGHAENTSVEGGTKEKVGEEDVERRGENVEAKDEMNRENVEMVETGNVGDEEKTSSGGGTKEEVGEEVVERREAKEGMTREDVDVVESGNVDYKERTSIAACKEKGVGEEDVERREETVEAKEVAAREDSKMVEMRMAGRQERTSVEGGEEEEVGRDGDVRREESVEVKESKREHVGMVEGENEENALVGRKEGGEKVSGESDVRREESVEGKEERKEDSEMAEVANVESGEKNVIEGGIEAEGEELDEGNDARREESVDGKGEDLEIAAAGNVESGEKTAIEGGLEAEGEEVGEDNDARREESVEGKEKRKQEDVGMTEGQNEEGTSIEGGEEDGEEVGEESNAFDEEESEEGEKTDASTEADFSAEKNRAHRENPSKKGDTKGEKQSASRGKESPRTPATSLIERPVRERKTVERLVEVIDKEPYKELLLIDKGRGTPLKDIPNVSYKLAKKKPGDLKLLHQTLFGRRGKATNFRNHILQFSGFAWNEDDEKQRAKVKDKLDKYVREILWDFCDLFDIPFSKTTTRKEDLVLKLLDFMVAPHAITDVIIAGKDEQSQKTKKRKRVSEGAASKNMDGMLAKGLRKKQDESKRTTAVNSKAEGTEEEDEEDNKSDYESDRHDEGKPYKHSDSDEFENKIEEAFDEQDDEQLKNAKRATSMPSKQRGSARKENVGTYPKTPPVTTLKKSSATTSSENQMEERNDVEVKVFSRKKKNVDALEKMSSSKPEKNEKSASYEHRFEESKNVEVKVFSRKKANDDTPKKTLSSKPVKNEKSTGKQLSTGNGKGGSGPNNEELRKTICEILKEVDFKATTFTDILKLLDTYYKMDLKPKKSAIKVMIQEELTRLADEAIENEDYEDEGAEGFASKNVGGMLLKGSTKKQDGGERTTAKRKRVDKEDNEKVNESGPPEEGRPFMHSDGDQSESEETDEPDDKHLKNGKQDSPRSSKQRGSARKEKVGTYPKTSHVTTMKKASETPHSDHRSKKSDDDNVKVFSRKKKSVDAHTKSSFKPTKKEKSTGKKLSTGRRKMGSIPSKEELRKTICEILKEIDFNTATFTDMLKQLTTYYKMDLTPKKSAIKLIIQEELSRLAEEVIENEDSVDEEESGDEDDTQPALKKMKV